MEAQKFNIGDKVIYSTRPYKVTHVYDNGNLKLRSINGKTNEIIFNVPIEFIQQEGK